jgi:hypothetical protein
MRPETIVSAFAATFMAFCSAAHRRPLAYVADHDLDVVYVIDTATSTSPTPFSTACL